MSVLDLPASLPPPPPPRPPRESILREMREDLAAGGGVWVLSGPSGIGKTHLARRLQAELAPTTQTVWVRGAAWGRPFQPLREAAESLRLWPLEEPALPRELAGVPAEMRQRETWISLFQKRGQDGPSLVLCCDDLESFDAPSWECVREMLRRRERLTVSLLLLVRPGPSRLALDALSKERRFEVPPLSAQEVAALCEERLGGPLGTAETHSRWLHSVTDGNPRHLLELLDFLRGTERLVPSGTGWRRAPEAGMEVPCFEELVRRRLEAALAREKPEVRSWIERGAVLGSRMDVPPSIAPALERVAERTGYLERTDESPASFRISDQRTREAIQVLCEDRRPTLDEGDPRLATLREEEGKWRQAAEETAVVASEALQDEMPSEAARLALWMDRLLGRAGEEPESPGRLAAAEIRAEALLDLGGCREIVDQLGPRAGGALRAGRSRLLYLLGAASVRLPSILDIAQGEVWLGQAQQCLAASDPSLTARIQLELARVHGEMNPREARRRFSKARELARKAKDVPLQIFLARRSRLFLAPGVARLCLEQGLKQASESCLELEEALCHNNLAVVFSELALLGVAEFHARACVEILEAYGPWGLAVPLSNLALVAIARGDWDRGEALLERALAIAGDAGTNVMVRCNQAMVRATLGAPDLAVRDLRRLVPEAGQDVVLRAILFNLARALLEAGQVAEALAAATVPPWLPGDEDLARAALASLRLQAFRQSGAKGRPEKGLLRQDRLLALSAKPQAWMYRSLWAPGYLLFL
ncbi:MAG TPA: AAA family ATPase [Thermoanaerobaculia bacterium]|nr:AAA family ATPase [Thermoanaerobaculia bacterium]